jgi:uncharacterized protein (DUF433 family)
MGAVLDISNELWWRRALLPNYKVGRAAQLVHLHPSTFSRWQNAAYVIPKRERGRGVSYLQLIEAAIVARMRKSGIKLSTIRLSRQFCSEKLQTEYPFATYKFYTDGTDLLMDFDDVFVGDRNGKAVVSNRGGQLIWSDMLRDILKTFDYENDVVIRWHVAGADNPIIIDPRIGFGAPTINGVPTEAIFDRWQSGDSSNDISEDYELQKKSVRTAINFEGRLRNEAFEGDFG